LEYLFVNYWCNKIAGKGKNIVGVIENLKKEEGFMSRERNRRDDRISSDRARDDNLRESRDREDLRDSRDRDDLKDSRDREDLRNARDREERLR
jgi:hypothetical protein